MRFSLQALVAPASLALLSAPAVPLHAQLVFSAPSTAGGLGLFEQRGARIVPLPTTQSEHYHPWISRNGRYISFSAPEPTAPGANPSSDLYVYDRSTAQTTRVINNETGPNGVGGSISARAISSAISPDATLMAYGVVFQNSSAAGPAGRALNVVNLSTGLAASNRLGLVETATDSLQAEFMGISWDPGGNSFVTPTYVLLGFLGEFPQTLPAIVRWTRQGDGNWTPAQLSTPQFTNSGFGAIFHIYPAISPSGAGLAYCSINSPDTVSGSTAAQVSIVRANADGSNPVVLGTFTPSQPGESFYPAGLEWSADGSRLVFSICAQAFTGTGWTTAANLASGQVYSIDSTTGQGFRAEPGLGGGLFPSAGSTAFDPTRVPQLILASGGSDDLTLSARNLDPVSLYLLRSTATLEAGSLGPPQGFTGQQLMSGIGINKTGPRRFFQIFDP